MAYDERHQTINRNWSEFLRSNHTKEKIRDLWKTLTSPSLQNDVSTKIPLEN